jgi:hypothetical protein
MLFAPLLCLVFAASWIWPNDYCATSKPDSKARAEAEMRFRFPPSATNIQTDCWWGASATFNMAPSDLCTLIESTPINNDAFVSTNSYTSQQCRPSFLERNLEDVTSYLHGMFCHPMTSDEFNLEIFIDTSRKDIYHVRARSYGFSPYGEPAKTNTVECPYR